jgi:hypothetical protein
VIPAKQETKEMSMKIASVYCFREFLGFSAGRGNPMELSDILN